MDHRRDQLMPKEHESATLSVVEAGRIVGLGRCAAYRAANRGDLPTIRIGGRLLVLRRPLERLLDGGESNRCTDPRSPERLGAR